MGIHHFKIISIILFIASIVQSTRFQGFLIINKNPRRILHQPLFPADTTPPPPPPPPPSTSDIPFFPEAPAGGTSPANAPPPPPPPLPTTTPVENASPVAATKKQKGKGFAIGMSIGIVVSGILLLGLAFFFFYKHKFRDSEQPEKKIKGNFTNLAANQESVTPDPPSSSNYLNIGNIMDPILENRDSSNGSSVHKRLSSVKMADRYRPSPELQPLPPLTKAPIPVVHPHPPPPRTNSSQRMSFSEEDDDEDEEESHESTFYTPQGSATLSIEEGYFTMSNNRFRADNTPASSSSVPHSKRTSPKSKRTSSSSPEKFDPKSKITASSSPEKVDPGTNPPLMQSSEAPVRPKFSSLPPPPDFARLKLITKQANEIYKAAIPQPKPPPPPPPPPPPLPHPRQLSTPKPSEKATRATQQVIDAQSSSPRLQFSSKIEETGSVEEGDVVHNSSSETSNGNGGDESRPKLKPLHWDKVRASSDRVTVWDKLNSSSFELNEDVMESLFGTESSSSVPKEVKKKSVAPSVEHETSVLDPKKSHNIAILLRALNVTIDEVSDALLDGNLEGLGPELLETLVKMAPTKEEEIKLRDYNGDPSKLGSAERFLKAILDIPLAFKRVDAMLYRANFDTEVNYLTNSFLMLEEASKELKNSKLFLKLLEAVLRTGNRMNVGTNRGDATSFKLDTLLKLADVKGTDGKTTLLHFVVQEIIKSEEVPSPESSTTEKHTHKDQNLRKQGLHILTGLTKELENVKKVASMDSDVLSSYVTKLESGLDKVRLVLRYENPNSEKGQFFESMKKFLKEAEESISMIKIQEQRGLDSVKEATQYFHGDAVKEEAHPFRIFVIVRDFITVLDKVCKEVGKFEDRSMVVGTSSSFRGPTTATTSLLPRVGGYNVRKDGSSSDGFSP